MKSIVWLASYPKSGNTWFRAFLANLLRDGDEPVDINELDTGMMATSRVRLDTALGYDSANLSHDAVDALRRELYLREAQQATEALFSKVHDAYTLLPDGRPIFPPEATKAVLYFIRNPLDVCVSYAHHTGGVEHSKMVATMANPNYFMCGGERRRHPQLRQKMLSWSQHVLSWTTAPGQRVHVMRYEDMLADPFRVFSTAAEFVGLPTESARIEKALRFSSFDVLKRQEQESGFKERMKHDRVFFRKGKVGSWREQLSEENARRIAEQHAEVMGSFGYSDLKVGV